jgi:hypothetical protein
MTAFSSARLSVLHLAKLVVLMPPGYPLWRYELVLGLLPVTRSFRRGDDDKSAYRHAGVNRFVFAAQAQRDLARKPSGTGRWHRPQAVSLDILGLGGKGLHRLIWFKPIRKSWIMDYAMACQFSYSGGGPRCERATRTTGPSMVQRDK